MIVAMEPPDACTACGSSHLCQDEDVLDTWFSSALFPFSTMGWPDETPDLARYYPTTVLVTGFDIITFWVSRMMMMGIHFTGTEPFRDVVIHGMVRDYEGRKMSKSFGNVMDPLDLADQYGADSLRLALLQAAAPGHDIPLDEQWVAATRRFGNKLWNALRFAVDHTGITGVPVDGGYPVDPGPEDAWILQRLGEVATEFDALVDEHRISDGYGLLYNFAWGEVFDWYIEMAKAPLRDEQRAAATKATLGVVLRDVLKLFHPAIPFITEELWSHLGSGELLITAAWPEVPPVKGPSSMTTFQDLATEVRRFRSEHQISPRTEITMILHDPSGAADDWWEEQLAALTRTRLVTGDPPDVPGHSRLVSGPVEAFIPLAGIVDLAAEQERLGKAVAHAEAQLHQVRRKLGDQSFVERAPADVVAKERAKLEELTVTVDKLQTQLRELG
jgi:valyl-tRNA synthetase